jgi:hypothetical protein
MGMLWLQNSRIRITDIFPVNLPKKVCVNFCCRGIECKKKNEEACTFLHPCSVTNLKLETIKKIGGHFKSGTLVGSMSTISCKYPISNPNTKPS